MNTLIRNFPRSPSLLFNPEDFADLFQPLKAMHPMLPEWAGLMPLELVETEESFQVTAELPGIKKEDVSVEFKDHLLTLKASTQQKTESSSDQKTWSSERYYGEMERSVTISTPILEDHIQAELKDGVLCVILPKATPSLQKSSLIEVK